MEIKIDLKAFSVEALCQVECIWETIYAIRWVDPDSQADGVHASVPKYVLAGLVSLCLDVSLYIDLPSSSSLRELRSCPLKKYPLSQLSSLDIISAIINKTWSLERTSLQWFEWHASKAAVPAKGDILRAL
jgi:hypothetical protein